MIAQKQFSVLNAEIKSSSPPQLLAIKAYASYLSSGDADSNLKLLGESQKLEGKSEIFKNFYDFF